jgi:uncharacterized protein YgbK (DUF1537 family)
MMILADDLTGAVDTGAFPVACGKEVKVYVDWRNITEDLPESEIVSVNMGSRTLKREDSYLVHSEVTKKIRNYGGHIVKKTDMGFRGNVAAEIEALLTGLGAPVCFLLPSLPDFNTFTLYGNQYVKGCILPQSLYSQDPIHKPDCAFIPEILARGTALPIDYVDIDCVKGDGLLPSVAEKMAAGVKILVFDSVTNGDCSKIIDTLLDVYPTALWAGTLGLLRAFTVKLYGDFMPVVNKKRNIKNACFSATKYTTSMEQIERAQLSGLQVITLDLDRVLQEGPETIIDQVFSACVKANQTGDFMVITHLSSKNEFPDASQFILSTLIECAGKVCQNIEFDRLVIIGGETSNALFSHFGTTKLLLNQKPETGIAAGVLLDGLFAGREFAAKGGSVGTVNALEKMLCKYED